jgi:hypothetical protein
MPGAWMPSAASRKSFTPAAFSISSAAMPPGRSTRTPPASTLTMVDSSPTGVAPPSTISSSRSPRSAATASAVVAVMRPDDVGAGGGQRPAELGDQVMREAARHPQRHRAKAGRDQRMDGRTLFQLQHQRQRPRPECLRQPARDGIEHGQPFRHRHVGDMGDQRVEMRPALGLEYPCHGRAIGGVARQPVDRLGRNRDDAARPQYGERGPEGFMRVQDIGPRRDSRLRPRSIAFVNPGRLGFARFFQCRRLARDAGREMFGEGSCCVFLPEHCFRAPSDGTRCRLVLPGPAESQDR